MKLFILLLIYFDPALQLTKLNKIAYPSERNLFFGFIPPYFPQAKRPESMDAKKQDKSEGSKTGEEEAKSETEAKGAEEHKGNSVEDRLYAIEDKVDHLLFHLNHEVTPHYATMTPWGPSIVPKQGNSIHDNLRMIDFMHGAPVSPMLGTGFSYMNPMASLMSPYSMLSSYKMFGNLAI